MNISNMNLDQVNFRMSQISEECKSATADIEALAAETDLLIARKNELIQSAAEKRALLAQVANSKTAKVLTKREKRKITKMTNEEVRASKEYLNAYAEYIKTDNAAECRALLTEMVSGSVPVPTYVEDRIRTAWQKNELMSLVKKTKIKGILKIGFERSATGAVIHTEGSAAPAEETLALGIVTLTPESIKKWITISDEAMDLHGEAFIDYIVDELTYHISKKAQSELIAKITVLTASATSTAVGVGIITGAPSVGIVADAIGTLSEEAENPVIVMNKGTWAKFKNAQYANGYDVDPFEDLPVHFDNTLPVYSTTGTAGYTWMIVGDFYEGAQANFPNGEEIEIKIDELSLSEKDMVKFVGREYIGTGIVADHAFCKVTF